MESEKTEMEASNIDNARKMPEKSKEEVALVLDFLPNGYPYDERPLYMKTPIVQAVGREHFVLLELVPKKGIHLQPFEEVYIGDGKRDKIHHIVGKIPLEKLTATAKMRRNLLTFSTGPSLSAPGCTSLSCFPAWAKSTCGRLLK